MMNRNIDYVTEPLSPEAVVARLEERIPDIKIQRRERFGGRENSVQYVDLWIQALIELRQRFRGGWFAALTRLGKANNAAIAMAGRIWGRLNIDRLQWNVQVMNAGHFTHRSTGDKLAKLKNICS